MPYEKEAPVPCEKCGVKDATHFITSIRNGVTSRHHLCGACALEDSSLGVGSYLQQVREAKCEYCGGSACTGSEDTLAMMKGFAPHQIWKCFSCNTEHLTRTLEEMKGIPDDLPPEQQMETLVAIQERVEAHMRRFVAMRDN